MCDLRQSFQYVALWFCTLAFTIALGILLMMGAASISRESINEQLYESATYLKDADAACMPVRLIRDNYTDAIMLFMGAVQDSEKPLESALSNLWYTTPEYNFCNPQADLYRYLTSGTEGMLPGSYSRYWHGYLVVIKPLLVFLNYEQIRYLNYAFIMGLLAYVCVLAHRRFSWPVLASFLLAMLYASIFFVPQSFQYCNTFYIALIGSVLVLRVPAVVGSLRVATCVFMVLGACTSFVDFLVSPMVTLGIPLIFLVQLQMEKSVKVRLQWVGLLSLCWMCGYVGMWAGKWVLTALLTDMDVVSVVGQKLAERSYGEFCLNLRQTCSKLIWFLPDVGKLWWAIVMLSIGGGVFLLLIRLYKQRRAAFIRNVPTLAVALLPFGWTLIAYQHTVMHMHFTHRIWCVFVFAVSLFVVNVCKGARN